MGMERGNKVLGWDGREWEWSRVDAVVTRYKGFVRFIDSSATGRTCSKPNSKEIQSI
jgi:hypothetical protein